MDLKTIARVQTNGTLLARFKAAVQKAAVAIITNQASDQAHVDWAIRANFKLLENRSQEYGAMILSSALIEIPQFGEMLDALPEDLWGEVGTDEQVYSVVLSYVERFAARNI